ncbi:hypothetical protein [Nocardioides currus]|nr:hypothetical protein [Nocardioides currus]
MIRADDVMPLVLAALPSFAGTWHEITSHETHVGEDGVRAKEGE